MNIIKKQKPKLFRNKNDHIIIQRTDIKKAKQLWYNTEFKCLRQNKSYRVKNFLPKQKWMLYSVLHQNMCLF